MNWKRITTGFAIVLALASCSLDRTSDYSMERGRGSVVPSPIDSEPKPVIQMPDQYANISYACDEYGNIIYSNTSHNTMFALKDGCEGGTTEEATEMGGQG